MDFSIAPISGLHAALRRCHRRPEQRVRGGHRQLQDQAPHLQPGLRRTHHQRRPRGPISDWDLHGIKS